VACGKQAAGDSAADETAGASNKNVHDLFLWIT
jgi:hypothetical protein